MRNFNENWDGVLRQNHLNEEKVIAVPTSSDSPLNSVYADAEGKIRCHFKGAGSLAFDSRGKEMALRLKELSDNLASGRMTCEQVHEIVTNPKGAMGNLTGYYLSGFADAEKLMKTPEAKRKVTNLKKGKS